jgi:hypothetical protein
MTPTGSTSALVIQLDSLLFPLPPSGQLAGGAIITTETGILPTSINTWMAVSQEISVFHLFSGCHVISDSSGAGLVVTAVFPAWTDLFSVIGAAYQTYFRLRR